MLGREDQVTEAGAPRDVGPFVRVKAEGQETLVEFSIHFFHGGVRGAGFKLPLGPLIVHERPGFLDAQLVIEPPVDHETEFLVLKPFEMPKHLRAFRRVVVPDGTFDCVIQHFGSKFLRVFDGFVHVHIFHRFHRLVSL